jgi:hypothetical protein
MRLNGEAQAQQLSPSCNYSPPILYKKNENWHCGGLPHCFCVKKTTFCQGYNGLNPCYTTNGYVVWCGGSGVGAPLTRVNSTNVLDEGLRIGEVGRWMNSKVNQSNKVCIESKYGDEFGLLFLCPSPSSPGPYI